MVDSFRGDSGGGDYIGPFDRGPVADGARHGFRLLCEDRIAMEALRSAGARGFEPRNGAGIGRRLLYFPIRAASICTSSTLFDGRAAYGTLVSLRELQN